MVASITVNPILKPAQQLLQGQPSFVQRLIKIGITLAADTGSNQPSTFTDGSNSVTLEGQRISASVQNSGAPANNSATVKVYGLTPSLMNQLTTLGIVYQQIKRNTLTILAGDLSSGMSAIFSGVIAQAYADYNNAPDVPFIFECQTGLDNMVAPALASSFTGATDIVDIAAGLARQMSRGFSNEGVTGKLSNPYYSGNLYTQLNRLANDGQFKFFDDGTTITIWPNGASRTIGDQPLISPSTGMIGYPTFTTQGIILKTIFNPKVSRGQIIRVDSSIKLGTATWTISKIDHLVESQVPGGKWESQMWAYDPKYPTPVPPKA